DGRGRAGAHAGRRRSTARRADGRSAVRRRLVRSRHGDRRPRVFAGSGGARGARQGLAPRRSRGRQLPEPGGLLRHLEVQGLVPVGARREAPASTSQPGSPEGSRDDPAGVVRGAAAGCGARLDRPCVHQLPGASGAGRRIAAPALRASRVASRAACAGRCAAACDAGRLSRRARGLRGPVVNIGVNARRLEGQPLGVARYIEYLLQHWTSMLAQDERVTLYMREEPPAGRVPGNGRYRVEVKRPKLRGFMWENLRLAPGIHGVAVFFGPSYSLPLPYRGRTVVTIHSVNEVQEGTHPWWYPFTFTRIYRASARKADCVIVPSLSVKQDIQEAYGIDAERIAVVGEGADDDFRPVEDEEVLRRTRIEQLGEDRPYVVFVG